MNVSSILLAGLLATAVMTIVLAGSQSLGLTRMSLPYLLGTLFTGNRDRAMLLGTVVHFGIGWGTAVVYALFFEDAQRAGPWIGAGAGALHGLFVLLVVVPLLPSVHPRMASERRGPEPSRQLEPPGPLGLSYGRRTPIVSLVAHVLYGAILGALYHPVSAAAGP